MADREYFSYTLNFKGLLLFLILYGSINKNKSDERVFNNVLYNPSILKIAPFLKYLNDFEKFGFKGKELVVTIAEELRNQLHLDIRNGILLLERAIERYYKEVENYFKDHNIPKNKINDYRKNMISILRDFNKDKEEFYSFVLKNEINLSSLN